MLYMGGPSAVWLETIATVRTSPEGGSAPASAPDDREKALLLLVVRRHLGRKVFAAGDGVVCTQLHRDRRGRGGVELGRLDPAEGDRPPEQPLLDVVLPARTRERRCLSAGLLGVHELVGTRSRAVREDLAVPATVVVERRPL